MRAPKLPSFIKNVKKDPRQFKLRSRHYDPKKEEMEKRKRAIESELGLSEEGYHTPPSIKITGKKYKKQNVRGANRKSNLRLIVILAVLCGLAYWGYQYLGKFAI